jgi:hypothetical protein
VTPPVFTRRPGEHCDWCGEPSIYVARARYQVPLGEAAPLVGEVLVCVTCAARIVRVAMGHER